MRSLRIFVNGIELDHVRADLKVRQENSSFFENLKVQHTTQPIRIVENEAAVGALGELSIASAKKKKYFDCKVVMGAIRFNGVLTQNERIPGFRKCDLKFGSEINGIMDKAIASFFPTINVLNYDFYPAYSEESDVEHGALQQWVDLAASLEKKVYPETKWQLPMMRYKSKFGTDLKEDDTWYEYKGYINNRILSILTYNIFATSTEENLVINYSVVAPQVFVLSPLFYAFDSLGYSLQGNVVRSGFFKRMLLLSFNDNMTKVVKRIKGQLLDLSAVSWVQGKVNNIFSVGYPTYLKDIKFPVTSFGDYKVAYKWEMNLTPEQDGHMFGIQAFWNGEIVGKETHFVTGVFEGSFSFTVNSDQVGDEIFVRFHSTLRVNPVASTIEVIKNLPDKDLYDIHPTIDFSRYIPDWTVAEYLNNFQNLFNLKIDIDDVEKSVSLNFNENDFLIGGEIVNINKSLQISAIKNIEAESYILKFANDDDSFQFISQEISQVNREGNENTKILETKFKFIPSLGGTSDLSERVEDKDGQGLILYDPVRHPYTSESFQGRNLKITGEGGIFESDWRRWILFRLNSGNVTLKGPFTQTELYKISKKQKLYIDNQLWLVKAIEYSENSNALFETELELESVTF